MSVIGACQRAPEGEAEQDASAEIHPAPPPTPGSNELSTEPGPPTALTCSGANISAPWGTAPFKVGPNTNEVLVEVAPHPTAAMTGRTFSSVYAIDGPSTFTQMASGARAIMDRTTGRFGIRDGTNFRFFSPAGTLLGDVTGLGPFQYFKFFPTAERVFAPEVKQLGLHSMEVDETEVLDLEGDVLDSFGTAGLLTSRTTPQYLFYFDGGDLVQKTLVGTEVWSIAGNLVDFRVSHTPTALAIAYAPGTGEIWHAFSGASSYTAQAISGVPWNLAMATDGRWSAATTHVDGGGQFSNLYIFRIGSLQATVQLPVHYAVSLAVNNDGHVLVGAQDDQARPVVFLFDGNQGDCLWSWTGNREYRHAHRPTVQFLGVDDRFVVMMGRGAVVFEDQGV